MRVFNLTKHVDAEVCGTSRINNNNNKTFLGCILLFYTLCESVSESTNLLAYLQVLDINNPLVNYHVKACHLYLLMSN